jgi:hypothetical protein
LQRPVRLRTGRLSPLVVPLLQVAQPLQCQAAGTSLKRTQSSCRSRKRRRPRLRPRC